MSLQEAYRNGLRAYVQDGTEEVLADVSALGRAAVSEDFPIEAIAELHYGALRDIEPIVSSPIAQERAAVVMSEFLMAFGLAYREQSARSQAMILIDAKRQKLEALGQLSAGVAHEFNNLLQPITGLSELLLDEDDLAPYVTESLGDILVSARKAAAIVRQILTYVRQTTPQPQRLSFAAVIEEEASFLKRAMPLKVHLLTPVTLCDGEVIANRSELGQVLQNLVLNASDAMPAGGTIKVSVFRNESNGLCFSVADTGVGMDAAVAGRIFEPFFTTKDPGKGTGLGLAVVQSIVSAWGGTISVTSQRGKGSCFTVCFPEAPPVAALQTVRPVN